MSSLYVREITREEHLAHLRRSPDASHLQIPEWGGVKPDWLPESIGWFEGEATSEGVGGAAGGAPHGVMVAAALVLYRPLPGTRRYLAYLPDGPAIDWRTPRPERWLDPLVAHLERIGAFSVRIGPPLVVRHWDAATVAAGIADPDVRHLRDLPAAGIDGYALDAAQRLRRLGWRPCDEDDDSGFGLGQPRYGCHIPLAGRSEDDLRGALAPHWEQSLRTAESADVRVSWVSDDDLPEFHRLYTATAAHDGFKARPLDYFRRMWQALNAEDEDRLRLYVAEYEGEVLSGALMINVGSRVWHSYPASGRRGRQLRPSSALLWRMLCDARAAGAETYDLRSITPALTEDRLLGRLHFKTGAGGRAVEYLGEWELPVGSQGKLLQRALGVYLGRR